jgi:hypothetical protein
MTEQDSLALSEDPWAESNPNLYFIIAFTSVIDSVILTAKCGGFNIIITNTEVRPAYEGVSKSFRTESIKK